MCRDEERHLQGGGRFAGRAGALVAHLSLCSDSFLLVSTWGLDTYTARG